MSKTVVGLFDTFDEAQSVVRELTDNGFAANDISLVANDANGEYAKYTTDATGTHAEEDAGAGAIGGGVMGGVLGLLVGLGALAIPGVGPVLAAGPLASALGSAAVGAGLGAATGGIIGGLVGAGIPEEDAGYYAEGVRRGGTLVMVQTSDDTADRAYSIMERFNPVDIDTRTAEWRSSGWSGFDTNAKPYSSTEVNSFRTTKPATNYQARETKQGETVLPVIEENVQIGKRQVQGTGGVRVHTSVTETPVEETVRLREERVNVERRPVDRPATDSDLNLRDQAFEVKEVVEEAVVNKQARVVEEVVVNKDVKERTETVRETARRQDVHIDQLDSERAVGSDYTTYETDFRNHFTSNYANSGYTYDQYSPVYRYGYTLANDQRYSGRDWSTIESDARSSWEQRNPNTWEQFKDSVRYAWDRVRGKV